VGADLVGAFLVAVLTPFAGWLLVRFSRREPVVADGTVVLRHGPAIAWLGWTALTLGVGALVVIPFEIADGESAFLIGLTVVFGLPFVALGLWFLACRRSEYVRLTPTGIEGRSGWDRAPAEVAWADVDRVRFSSLTGYLVLSGQRRQRVRVSVMLHGADEVAALVGRRVRAPGAATSTRQFREYIALYGGRPRPKR